MKAATRVPSMDNYRATFIRLKDSKILHGWVDGASESNITIRAKVNARLTVGDLFMIEVFGPVVWRFQGRLTNFTTTPYTMIKLEASVHNGVAETPEEWFSFGIESPTTVAANNIEPRVASQHVMASLIGESGMLFEEIHVADLSRSGLGLSSMVQIPPGDYHATVQSGTRTVTLSVRVVYSRQISKTSTLFRTGLKILGFTGRVNEMSWNALRAEFTDA
jgi:hypothetical protein